MSDFDFSTATVQEKIDERDRREECRRRGLPFFGEGTLGPGWRVNSERPVTIIEEMAELTPAQQAKLFGSPAPNAEVHRVELGARKITLPWTNLCRDNERLTPIIKGKKAIQITSKSYGEAKKRARDTAKSQLQELEPLTGPLLFVAVLYEPNRHMRDLGNYVKMVADSLKGLAYEDDSQIHDLQWRRGGVDIDAPRLEITIRQILDPHRSI